jgi:hypothetical protein
MRLIRATRAALERFAAHRLGPVALIAVVATTLRFYRLADAPANVDECFSWDFVHAALRSGTVAGSLARTLDGPLYSLLNLAVASRLGDSLAVLRGIAALFGVGGVLLFYQLLRRTIGPGVALSSGLLAAFSPFLLFHARSARPYSQFLFFGMAFALAFFATDGWRRWARRALLTALTVLAAGTYYVGLTYFAAFYLVVLWDHLRAGRRERLLEDFATGVISLWAALPVLLPLLRGGDLLSTSFWQIGANTLDGILCEQLLLAGTTFAGGGAFARAVSLTVTALVLAPAVFLARRRRWPQCHPLLYSLWAIAPLPLAAWGLFAGRSVLFYPRGFIGSMPFLLVYLDLAVRSDAVPRWLRRGLVMLLLPLFLLSSRGVVQVDMHHAYYHGVDLMPAVARALSLKGDDLLLVHSWWIAPYLRYLLQDRAEVQGAGEAARDVAHARGEVAAALADVEALPAARRVLLVDNDLARLQSDPGGAVEARLRATRTVLWERDCLEKPVAGFEWFCRKLVLFDRRTATHSP